MTIETLTLNILPLQEGNIADLLDVEFASEFPLAGVSEVICRVKTKGAQRAYLTKKLSEGTVTIAGQVLTVPLTEADSAGHAGDFDYECDFFNASGKSYFTMKGKGSFVAELK